MSDVIARTSGGRPGVARRQVSFLACPRKETKRRAPRLCGPSASPSVRSKNRAGRKLALRAQTSAPLFPVFGPAIGAAAEGERHTVGFIPLCATSTAADWRGKTASTVRAPQWAASCAARQGELRRRPGKRPSSRPAPQGWHSGVAFLWFLSLARQRKELAAGQPPANPRLNHHQQPTQTIHAENPWFPGPSNN